MMMFLGATARMVLIQPCATDLSAAQLAPVSSGSLKGS